MSLRKVKSHIQCESSRSEIGFLLFSMNSSSNFILHNLGSTPPLHGIIVNHVSFLIRGEHFRLRLFAAFKEIGLHGLIYSDDRLFTKLYVIFVFRFVVFLLVRHLLHNFFIREKFICYDIFIKLKELLQLFILQVRSLRQVHFR